MTLMTCSSVRRRLQSFHDRELPIRDLIDVESHVGTCPPCARDLRELQSLGEALRLAAAPGPSDDWTGLQPGVISRMRAERSASWGARAQRFIDDVHLVWIGLASATATVVLTGSMLNVVYAAPDRTDSLAAVFAMLGAEAGSDLNPASLDGRGLNKGPTPVQVPTVPQDGVVYATLEHASIPDDVMVPLSVRVTREGRVEGLAALDRSLTPRQVSALVQALSGSRFEPAQYGGDPVAVNLVWLLANTTVKPGKT
jgi:anti-sigma factor RsiW